jgi:hypothetical protein
MKTRATLIGLSLASALASPALAGTGAPASPPPETGIVTPYNGQRDSAPDEYPAASVMRARCAGQRGQTVLENGAATPGPASSAPQEVSDPAASAGQASAMVRGATTPDRRSPASDPTWCEGAYRPDAGSNFGE